MRGSGLPSEVALRHLFLCALSISLLAVSPGLGASDEKVLVVGFYKEGRVNPDGSGGYAELARYILGQVKTPSILITMPILRTVRTFKKGGDRCVLSALHGTWLARTELRPEDVVESEPIDYVTAHFVTRPGEPVITDARALEGKSLGHWVGAPVDRILPPDVSVNRVSAATEESNIHMLMSGRVDVIWSWIPDVYILFEKFGYGKPSLVPKEPLLGATSHILCHRSPLTERFIKQVDSVIQTMRSEGKLKEILSPYAQIVGEDIPITVWNAAPQK